MPWWEPKNNNPPPNLAKGYSTYLDLVRFIAALVVVLQHLPDFPRLYPAANFLQYGTDAVAVFFVLSGYVINYTVVTKEKTAFDYAMHRVARIIPVAIGALLMAAALDFIGQKINPGVYNLHTDWRAFPMSVLFLNRMANTQVEAFSIASYWSLSYEVWLYILFGVLYFGRGIWRFLLAGSSIFLIGPQLILWGAVWGIGGFAYYLHHKISVPRPAAILMAAVPVVIYIGLKFFDPIQLAVFYGGQLLAKAPVPYSGYGVFFWHFTLAVLVGLHLWGMGSLRLAWLENAAPAKIIRSCASYTFSIYLCHFPLMLFYEALLNGRDGSTGLTHIALKYTLIAATIVLFAHFTEHRKKPVYEFLKNGKF